MKSPAEILNHLSSKNPRLVCGVMSGTSADGVNIAFVNIEGSGTETRLTVLHHSSMPFSGEIRQMILENSEAATSNVEGLCLLHARLAFAYRAAILTGCSEAGLREENIDFIGLHGQTVHHIPDLRVVDGVSVRSTLQLGSGAALAALLGVPVISDFRSADTALGGQGAPLVPYVDFLLMRSASVQRVLLNIGGIANFTFLQAGCSEDEVLAYDTGPGNMIIDALASRFFHQPFDAGGTLARSGRVNLDLLAWCMTHPFLSQHPPKSAGREMFGNDFIDVFLSIASELGVTSFEDMIATASEFTVQTIARELRGVVTNGTSFELFVSGGGSNNRYLMDGLRLELPNACIASFSEVGLNPDAKEAICFAVLANEWISGHAANMPSVTGSSKKALLGSFSIG